MPRAGGLPPAVVAAPASPGTAGNSQAAVTPADGQGFTPAGQQGAPQQPAGPAQGQQGAPQQGQAGAAGQGAQGAAGAQGPAGAQGAAAGQPPEPSAPEVLAALEQQFAEEFSKPVVAANGNVYMERRKPVLRDGKLVLELVLVAKIDVKTGRIGLNKQFIEAQKPKRSPNAKLVKIEDRFFWQTPTKTADGQLVAKLEPASEAELQQAQIEAQQQQVAAEADEKNRSSVEWLKRLGTTSQLMKTTAYTGMFIDGLAQGPNPITGRSGGSWLFGYQILQMLDGQAKGELLPKWLKSGPIGTGLEWALQGYYMLDTQYHVGVLKQYMPRTAAVMSAFTAPTRAVIRGVAGLGKQGWAASAPGPMTGPATPLAPPPVLGGVGGEAMAALAKGAANAAKVGGVDPMQQGIKQLASEMSTGVVRAVGATDDAAVLVQQGGKTAVQLVPKNMLYEAGRMAEPKMGGLLDVRSSIDRVANGAIASLRPALQTLAIGGSIAGTLMAGMNMSLNLRTRGPQSLIMERDGRGSLFGLLSSGTFLGMQMLPKILPALLAAGDPRVRVAMSALNLAGNVFGGLSMLNYTGLFGDGGYLDHDAVRAAFLIPPLTPIGLFSMWMKRREKAKEETKARIEQNQKRALETVTRMRQQAATQLQATGQIQGATVQPDGTIVLPTGISDDLSKPDAVPQSAAVPADVANNVRIAATARPPVR